LYDSKIEIFSPRNNLAAASLIAAAPRAVVPRHAGIATNEPKRRVVEARTIDVAEGVDPAEPIQTRIAKSAAADTNTVPAGITPMPKKTKNRDR
jgi:hypothetical protein